MAADLAGVVGLLATAMAAGGCGVGDAAAGMSGQQVVQGHDVAGLFFADPTTLGFTRQAADPASTWPQDLWGWRLADAAPAVALPDIDWALPGGWARVRIGELLQTGYQGRMFYDFGSRLGVDRGPPYTLGSNVYVTAIRRDGGAVALTETGSVGVGAPTDLQLFPLDGAVSGLDFVGSDVALLYSPNSDIGTGGTVGVYRLGVPSGALTELVPATPVGEWADTLAGCPLGLGASPCPLFRVIGCAATDAVCPQTGAPPCAIVYVKGDPDNPGHTAAYAYDVNAASAFKLPGEGTNHLYVSPDQHLVLWDDGLLVVKRYWNLCTDKKDLCPYMDGTQVLWRGDSNGFVSVTTDGALAVASFTSDLCAGTPVAFTATSAFYSPSGDRLAWMGVADASATSSELWLAAADGSSPVEIASGSLIGGRFSPNGQHMVIARASGSSKSLSWLDLTVSPPAEHFLADNYGGSSRGGDRRVLLIDHWSSQDTSGDLVLLDMSNGARHELGHAATEFAIWGGVSASGADSEGTSVAYAVRSRVASDRDGLWLTALPP